jgi:putative tryptophan/tyrosine transport system substrate-binding protein
MAIHIGRREFIATLASAAAAWPLAARAQQPSKKLPTIGVLGAATPLSWRHWVAAFVQRLGELGWSEGRTVAIEYRWAEGQSERFPEIAAEFAQMNVDVIVTAANGVLPAKRATSTIPIVFVIANDPVGTGLVESLARPGGNATGNSIQSSDLAGKRLELLREVAPGLRRLAILTNVDYAGAVLEAGEVQDAAHMLGLEAVTLEIRQAEDIAPALDKLRGRAQGLYLPSEAIVFTNRTRIAALALDARLATITVVRDYVEAGNLLSYGANYVALFRRTAEYVDKILRGTKPGDIPVEQPTKFDLVVNLKTAKALGLTIPESFLIRADEVIE